MKILLAVDGSSCSRLAVAEVASRPWPAGSYIRIVSAFQVPVSPSPEGWGLSSENYEQMERAVREQAQAIVNETEQKLRGTVDQSISLESALLPGAPGSAIIEESERWQADLIVVGSHGYSALTRFLLGSVSQAVVAHAKCSVEVVRCKHSKEFPRNARAA
jgi:nucleotide-binding universal stress UspA family protein